MVRLYAAETCKKLDKIFMTAGTRQTESGAPSLDSSYGDNAQDHLDNLFD